MPYSERTGIDWDAVREELSSQEWYSQDNFSEERQVFLGTVFALYPSGKYYTPWACSNVEACKACREAFEGPCDEETPCTDSTPGDPSSHCEVCRDAAFGKALEEEASAHGYYITSGEGDPCDVMVGESRDKEEAEKEEA